ncbi:MAG TPA: DUF3109 family protein [Rhodothermales bacterium]|nr:DUF3109 family protein [Rhodothermales bacterium]
MFAVDHILISDELLDAPFSCNLGACLGSCCVQGDAGAPLDPDERDTLETLLPIVRDRLRPEALRVIEERGAWEETRPGAFATTCADDGACVFVAYEGRVATCALQRAYAEGRTDFPKPVSCHLYPIRAQQFGEIEALNYEQIPLCNPARKHGCRHNVQVVDFLREPLQRKYGAAWYSRFREAVDARRMALGITPGPRHDQNVQGPDTE